MLCLKVDLKHAIDIKAGPRLEEIWFDSVEDIERSFRHFPDIKVKEHKLVRVIEGKDYTVGEIYEGEPSE